MALRGGVGADGQACAVDVEDEKVLTRSLKQWTNSPGALGQGVGGSCLVPPTLPPEISLGSAALPLPVEISGEEKKMEKKISIRSSSGSSWSASESVEPTVFKGPKMITFDGDQTLYSDGANFEGNPQLANYLYLLLRHGVTLAVVTAAGYEYQTERYEMRLSGLLAYFKAKNLPPDDCERFYLFGGECNFLLKVRVQMKQKEHVTTVFQSTGSRTFCKLVVNSFLLILLN